MPSAIAALHVLHVFGVILTPAQENELILCNWYYSNIYMMYNMRNILKCLREKSIYLLRIIFKHRVFIAHLIDL